MNQEEQKTISTKPAVNITAHISLCIEEGLQNETDPLRPGFVSEIIKVPELLKQLGVIGPQHKALLRTEQVSALVAAAKIIEDQISMRRFLFSLIENALTCVDVEEEDI